MIRSIGAAAVFETACEENEVGSSTHMRVTTYGRDTTHHEVDYKRIAEERKKKICVRIKAHEVIKKSWPAEVKTH